MVRRLPGTDVEVSRTAYEHFSSNVKAKLGCCFYLLMIILVPAMIAIYLWSFVFGVASFVFSIQALVVGAQTYQLSPNCQRTIGVWLIVYGSLGLGSVVVGCLCSPRSNEETDHDRSQRRNACSFPSIVGLAAFGWLCYGVNIIYDNSSNYELCNPSQWHVFRIIVLFMFWGAIATLGAILVSYCVILPFVSVFADGPRSPRREDQRTRRDPPVPDVELGKRTRRNPPVPDVELDKPDVIVETV